MVCLKRSYHFKFFKGCLLQKIYLVHSLIYCLAPRHLLNCFLQMKWFENTWNIDVIYSQHPLLTTYYELILEFEAANYSKYLSRSTIRGVFLNCFSTFFKLFSGQRSTTPKLSSHFKESCSFWGYSWVEPLIDCIFWLFLFYKYRIVAS